MAVVADLKYFRQYPCGQKVTVRTDHASLRWLMNSKDPEGQLARWLDVVSEYDLTIQHRPGANHGNADGLSRRPCKQCTHCGSSEQIGGELSTLTPKVESAARVAILQPSLSNKDLIKAQMADTSIRWLVVAKNEGKERPPWKEISKLSQASKTY